MAGLNLYAYAGGDPLNKVDPHGLQEFVLPPLTVTSPRNTCQTQTSICGVLNAERDPLSFPDPMENLEQEMTPECRRANAALTGLVADIPRNFRDSPGWNDVRSLDSWISFGSRAVRFADGVQAGLRHFGTAQTVVGAINEGAVRARPDRWTGRGYAGWFSSSYLGGVPALATSWAIDQAVATDRRTISGLIARRNQIISCGS